ncbi:MAG: Ran-binding zinc finger domain-containing protein [Bacteroidota bacterium]
MTHYNPNHSRYQESQQKGPSPSDQAEEVFHQARKTGQQKQDAHAHPMKNATWQCSSCNHINKSEALVCANCHQALPVIALFKAHQIHSLSGDLIRLQWEVFEATEVLMIPGHQIFPSNGTLEITPDVGLEFTLVARNASGSRQITTQAVSLPPVIQSFTAVDTEISLDYAVILQWEVENVQQLELDRGIGDVSGKGFVEVYLDEPGPVTLTATNESGSVSQQLHLTLKKPEIHTFQSNTSNIQLGVPISFFWDTLNAAEVTLMPDEIDVTDYNQIDLFPEKTTTYTLVGRNRAGEVRKSIKLTLPPPRINHFGSDHAVSTEGSLVELSWDVENAYRVYISHEVGEVEVRGSTKVRPNQAYTDYILTAEGHSGVTQASFKVTRFPVPLEESLFVLDTPEPELLLMKQNESQMPKPLPEKNKQQHAEPPQPPESEVRAEQQAPSPETIEQDKFHIWRAQQMMLTEEMMRMEKASLRKEIKQILKKVRNKLGPKKS